MQHTRRFLSKSIASAPLGVLALASLLSGLSGCGKTESVYHDGNFSEEQKVAAQAEYQTVEDEESQGSNKKKKKAIKR